MLTNTEGGFEEEIPCNFAQPMVKSVISAE
jgi:hypothetical protein